MRIDSYKIVVEKNVCLAAKGEIGLEKVEPVRLDDDEALLNRYNHRLERECNELTVTIWTLIIEDREATTGNSQSVFRPARNRRAAIRSVHEMQIIFQ